MGPITIQYSDLTEWKVKLPNYSRMKIGNLTVVIVYVPLRIEHFYVHEILYTGAIN